MEFTGGQTVYRHRYPLVTDPYNTARQVADPSSAPVTITIPAAFIGSSSSVGTTDATRSQVLSTKSLFVTDISADVQLGDRIGTTADPDAAEFVVDAIPVADTNPFTGWQPVREIPLEAVRG